MPPRQIRPRVAITMGDVAGIGPEVIARAWSDPVLHDLCEPFVVGDPDVLRKALSGSRTSIALRMPGPYWRPSPASIPGPIAAKGL